MTLMTASCSHSKVAGKPIPESSPSLTEPLLAEEVRLPEACLPTSSRPFCSLEESERNVIGLDSSLLGRLFGLFSSFFLLRWITRSSTLPDFSLAPECRALLREISTNKSLRAQVCQLRGANAQNMVDFIDMVLREGCAIQTDEGRCLLSLLHDLVSSAWVFPRWYELREVQYDLGNPDTLGGFADVYQGLYKKHAICLKFPRRGNADYWMMHLNELISWSYLSHPNILPFQGIYLPDQSRDVVLASSWMKNGNLRQQYARDLPHDKKLLLIFDVVEGLGYLHSLDIAHGDLKGPNVLISDQGTAMIADFGLSCFLTGNLAPLTSAHDVRTPIVAGSARWTAPEIFTGDDQIRPSKASDIWSLGCLIYEILTHLLPFPQYLNDFQVIAALQRAEPPVHPPQLSGTTNEVSNGLWALIDACLRFDPEARPTCWEVRSGILELLESQGGQSAVQQPAFNSEKVASSKPGAQVDYGRVYELLLEVQL